MAITIDYGYPVSETTKNLAIPEPVYSNWALKSMKTDSTGKQVTREDVNIASPIDRQAIMKTWRRKIDDVYAESRINNIYQSPIKEGVQLGHTVSAVVSISDSNADLPTYVPLSAQISIVTGLNPNIGKDAISSILKQALTTCFPEGTVTLNQLANWLAGSLTYLDESSED